MWDIGFHLKGSGFRVSVSELLTRKRYPEGRIARGFSGSLLGNKRKVLGTSQNHCCMFSVVEQDTSSLRSLHASYIPKNPQDLLLKTKTLNPQPLSPKSLSSTTARS